MKPNRNLYNKPRKLFTAQSTHKFLVLLLFTVFIYLSFASCNTTEPPKPKPEKPKLIELKEITKSCTETFIKVSTKDTFLPTNVVLQRDGKEIMSFYQTKRDTTLIDTGLAVEQTYTYQAIIKNKGEEGKSKEIEISTLPTTSSNFTWKKYTFGSFQYGSSDLNDVAIINENDIWAVGEIHTADDTDSSGHSVGPYNAVHWNGEEWELKRITTKFHGYNITVPLEGIYSFSENDIWFVGSLPIHWNGTHAIMYDVRTTTDPNLSLSKAWGRNTNDMYFVGRSGSIAHYNGTNWEKIESGTNLIIHNIFGDINPSNGETEIICCASTSQSKDSEIIKIKADLTTEKIDASNVNYVFDLWFKPGIRYYVTGNGLYEKRYNDKNKWVDLNKNRKITSNFINGINGSGLNEIFISGAFGEILHYNGMDWKSLKNEVTTLINGSYFSISLKENIVIAVGYDRSRAVILMGKRN